MILAFGHAANTGKDAAARILVERHGFTRRAFADAVRKVAYDTQPALRTLVDRHGWEDAKRTYPQIRQALVAIGMAGRRHIGEDCWIRPVLDVPWDGDLVISDLRHRNEADAIRARGGILVKLTRPGVSPLADPCDTGLSSFTGWHHIIANDGTLEDLADKLAPLVGVSKTIREVDMTGYFTRNGVPHARAAARPAVHD